MGFREILVEWRLNGRTTDAARAETAIEKLRDVNPQTYDNLNNDTNISQAKRKELFEQLLTAVVQDEHVVGNRVVSFCQAHQCRGPRQRTATGACLGHVEKRAKTEKTLASAGMPTSGLTRGCRSPTLAIDMILRQNLDDQRTLLAGISLSLYEMWSFYQSRAVGDPFRGVSKNAGELVRRLGLGHIDPTEELLLWAHRLGTSQAAHVPTAFDAELYEYYRHGGKTKPLTGDDGLREVVHSPVVGTQLTHRIERAS